MKKLIAGLLVVLGSQTSGASDYPNGRIEVGVFPNGAAVRLSGPAADILARSGSLGKIRCGSVCAFDLSANGVLSEPLLKIENATLREAGAFSMTSLHPVKLEIFSSSQVPGTGRVAALLYKMLATKAASGDRSIRVEQRNHDADYTGKNLSCGDTYAFEWSCRVSAR